MELLEVVLNIVVYTLLVIALFLELICYRRNLEYKETIFFTFSLLLLVVAMTVGYFNEGNENNVFVTLSMVLVGLTTPLSIMAERHHGLPAGFKKVLFGLSGGLLALVVLGILWKVVEVPAANAVAIFLGVSVVFSMALLIRTKPKGLVAHREKAERYLAILFLVIIPLTLLANYISELQAVKLNTGFTLPAVFILLAGSKIWDDVQRLSLFSRSSAAPDFRLEQYALTKREKEVAQLLLKGSTYKEISEELFISLPTVKTHASKIYKKCQVKSRAELMVLISS